MSDQPTDAELIAKAREECASAIKARSKGSHFTWPVELVDALAARLEAANRELGKLRPEVEMLRTEAAGGVHDPHDQLEALYADLCRERDEARARVAIAEDLLKRVVIHGGSGSWTWREMHDWCCDYKDWSSGNGREMYERSHDNCGHRSRPGTECGAVGAGDSDEPVPHLFGPDGLLKRVAELDEEVVSGLQRQHSLEAQLALAKAEPGGWRSIETKPQDGTLVVGYLHRMECYDFVRWSESSALWMLDEVSGWSDDQLVAWAPLPLPPPPSVEEPPAGAEGGEVGQ